MPSGSATRAAIVGVAGQWLRPAEQRLLARRPPLGFILFARNCRAPDQVRTLIAELRSAVGRGDAPVFIDQEGGRVARLRPPAWPQRLPARAFGELARHDPAAAREAAWLQARLIAADLADLGVTVDCIPVLDLDLAGESGAIRDRAFASDPEIVALLGRATVDGLAAGGILPVIKHLPGHGRTTVDSHLALPVVDAPRAILEATDWQPFARLRDAPFAMTAHVLYPALDPDSPATHSRPIIEGVIRGQIGFAGALLSDDLSMQALGGRLALRAARTCAAGCDLALHCNGDFEEMREVLEAAGPLEGEAGARVARALAAARPAAPLDAGLAAARLDALMRGLAPAPVGVA